MKDGDDIHEHVRKFSDKIYELNEMEVDRNVNLQVLMFLLSLPRCFENFKRAIESRNYLPSPETLRTEVIEVTLIKKIEVSTQNKMPTHKR